ncbi:MAG TPA: transposase [Sphingomicrobium sp.]|nr:transposase [Sphingomicrobium sp.]
MQSAHKPRFETFAVIEAVAERLEESPPLLRRRWPEETKAGIVAETMLPGANVSAVARAHGLRPQQLFSWRRKALRSGTMATVPVRSEGLGQSFAPVELVAGDGARAAGLEIVIGDATIRVGGGVEPALLAEAIRAVRSA